MKNNPPDHIDDNHILERAVGDAAPDADVKEYLLATAGKLVSGERRKTYGTPEKNFNRIALLWRAWFEARGIVMTDRDDRVYVLSAEDVSPLMRLMKEARLCENPTHLDSLVDIIGYTLTDADCRNL